MLWLLAVASIVKSSSEHTVRADTVRQKIIGCGSTVPGNKMGPSVQRAVEGMLQGQRPRPQAGGRKASYMYRPSTLSVSLESGLSALG